MTQELDQNQCNHGRPQKCFQGSQRRHFAYPLQVANDAMQMYVRKMLYPFYPFSLCQLKFITQSFVGNVFYTSAIRYVFSFHKLPNIRFFRALSTNKSYLRIIYGQNNMSRAAKIQESYTLSQNCFKQ